MNEQTNQQTDFANCLISKQAAIDALGEKPLVWDDLSDFDLGKAAQWSDDVDAIKELPSAQPQLEDCPIYGGMCGYPSNLCYECPRHGGAHEKPLWWTAGLQPFAQPQRWIPVTERLPEDIRPVIVTWCNTDPASYYQHIVGKRFTGVAHYKSGKWYWYSSTTEDFLAEYGRYDVEEFDEAIEVLAWCELPDPWKGEHG